MGLKGLTGSKQKDENVAKNGEETRPNPIRSHKKVGKERARPDIIASSVWKEIWNYEKHRGRFFTKKTVKRGIRFSCQGSGEG